MRYIHHLSLHWVEGCCCCCLSCLSVVHCTCSSWFLPLQRHLTRVFRQCEFNKGYLFLLHPAPYLWQRYRICLLQSITATSVTVPPPPTPTTVSVPLPRLPSSSYSHVHPSPLPQSQFHYLVYHSLTTSKTTILSRCFHYYHSFST